MIKIILKRAYYVLTTVICALIFFSPQAYAGPANPSLQELTQPTGEKFKATLHGDEHFNWLTTETGEVIIKDTDGFWRYGQLQSGLLVPSDSRYEINAKPRLAVSQDQLVSLNKQKRKDSIKKKSPTLFSPIIEQRTPLTKPSKLLVLLISFNDGNVIRQTESYWSNKLFGTTGKSLRNYYTEVSGGKFYFEKANESYRTANDGIVKVTLNYPHPGLQSEDMSYQMVKDTLTQINPYVNFAAYDTNNDGFISSQELHVVTVIAGYESSYQSGPSPAVWAHQGILPEAFRVNLDNKTIGDTYVQLGEYHEDHPATIGVFAHELGHDLGLPDLYDCDGSSLGVGIHSLMAMGMWGWAPGKYETEYPGSTPSHLDAWSKVDLGFFQPTLIASRLNIRPVRSIGTGQYNILKIPTKNPWEYFLIENRQFEGFDAALYDWLLNGGIAIWHIDESVINSNYRYGVNDNENHKGVDLEEANEDYLGYSQLDYSELPWYDHYYYDENGQNHVFDFTSYPDSNLYNGESSGIIVVAASPSQSEMDISVNLTIPRAYTVNVTTDKNGPQPIGTTIGFTATVSGTENPRYEFWIKKDDEPPVPVQDYSLNNTLSWTPSEPGNYEIRAYAKDVNSSSLYDSYSSITFKIVTPVSIKSITSDKLTPQPVNTKIRWSCAADGTENQYAFYVYKGATPIYKGTFGNSNYFDWTPTETGEDYRIRVLVKNPVTTSPVSRISPYFKISQSLTISSLIPNKAGPQSINTTIRWTCDANGENNLYAFQVYKGTLAVYKGSYSVNNYLDWTPTEPRTDYRIKVFVKNATVTTPVSLISPYYTITTSEQGININSLLPDKLGPQPVNTTIRWTCNATGINNLYAFQVYKGSTAIFKGSYSNNNYLNWTPISPGNDYRIKVFVKNATVATPVSLISPYYTITTSAQGITINSLIPDKLGPQPINTTIRWTCNATGSNNLYAFQIYKGSTAIFKGSYSSNNYLNWTPISPGNDYRIKVFVKNNSVTTPVSLISPYYQISP